MEFKRTMPVLGGNGVGAKKGHSGPLGRQAEPKRACGQSAAPRLQDGV